MKDRLSMLSFVKDLPNIISLLGLLSAVIGVFFAVKQVYYAAIIGLLWAVLFDWLDGLIAGKMKYRTEEQAAFGGQIDSLIDIVSFGVLPAVILFSYGNFSPWFIPGAFVVVAACAIRLSYFNVFGLTDAKTYTGLAVDYNGLILSFAFLFERFFSHTNFSIGLYVLLMIVSGLNLAQIPIKKFSKKWISVIAGYVFILSIYFGWILWNGG